MPHFDSSFSCIEVDPIQVPDSLRSVFRNLIHASNIAHFDFIIVYIVVDLKYNVDPISVIYHIFSVIRQVFPSKTISTV